MVVAINPNRAIEVRDELTASNTSFVEIDTDDGEKNEEESADPAPKPLNKGTCFLVLLRASC